MKAIVLVVGALLLAGCCKGKTSEQRAADQAANKQWLDSLAATSAAVSAFPSDKACSGDASSKYVSIDTVDVDYLKWLSSAEEKPSDLGDFSYLRTALPSGIKINTTGYNDNDYRINELKRKGWLGVWKVSKKVAPQMTGPKSYSGGSFEASLVVIDLSTMKPVCAATVQAESSADVSTKPAVPSRIARKLFEKQPAEAVRQDLKENIEDAADAALKKASSKLTINL